MRYNLTQVKLAQASFKSRTYSHHTIFSSFFIQMKFCWNNNEIKKSQVNKIDTILCLYIRVAQIRPLWKAGVIFGPKKATHTQIHKVQKSLF